MRRRLAGPQFARPQFVRPQFARLQFSLPRIGGLRAGAPSLRVAPALAPSRRDFRELVPALHRALVRHRRMLAAGCAGIAAATALMGLAPKHAAQAGVIAAARDLPPGTTITPDDLRMIALPAGVVPAGAVTATSAVVGRRIAGALRRGEPLTDVRLEGGPLAHPAAGLVAAPVRFADPEAARLLQPGQHIDVLAASTSSVPGSTPPLAAVVAADVAVLALPSSTAAPGGVDPAVEGALVVLATTPEQARALAQAAVSARLSAVVVR